MKPGGLLVLTIALAAVAGCASGPSATPVATNATVAAGALPPLTRSLPVSNAIAEPGVGVEPTDAEKATLDIPAGYTHLKAELKATCQSPTCGYGLYHGAEGQAPAFEASGKVDAAVHAGKYDFAARSTGPARG